MILKHYPQMDVKEVDRVVRGNSGAIGRRVVQVKVPRRGCVIEQGEVRGVRLNQVLGEIET